VIERAGVTGSLSRSRELVSGNAWRVFGVIVVLFLLTAIVGSILNAIGGSISDSFVGYALGDLIGRVLLSPLSAIAATVMFVELRRAKGQPLTEDTTGTPPPLSSAPEAPQTPAAPPPAPESPAGQ
jgi:hypothetical protein